MPKCVLKILLALPPLILTLILLFAFASHVDVWRKAPEPPLLEYGSWAYIAKPTKRNDAWTMLECFADHERNRAECDELLGRLVAEGEKVELCLHTGSREDCLEIHVNHGGF